MFVPSLQEKVNACTLPAGKLKLNNPYYSPMSTAPVDSATVDKWLRWSEQVCETIHHGLKQVTLNNKVFAWQMQNWYASFNQFQPKKEFYSQTRISGSAKVVTSSAISISEHTKFCIVSTSDVTYCLEVPRHWLLDLFTNLASCQPSKVSWQREFPWQPHLNLWRSVYIQYTATKQSYIPSTGRASCTISAIDRAMAPMKVPGSWLMTSTNFKYNIVMNQTTTQMKTQKELCSQTQLLWLLLMSVNWFFLH